MIETRGLHRVGLLNSRHVNSMTAVWHCHQWGEVVAPLNGGGTAKKGGARGAGLTADDGSGFSCHPEIHRTEGGVGGE